MLTGVFTATERRRYNKSSLSRCSIADSSSTRDDTSTADFDRPAIAAKSLSSAAASPGLSAAIYLGRAQRDTLVIDSGHSMAKWEPVVENYLGFPDGVGGEELLQNGCAQAKRHESRFVRDKITTVSADRNRSSF